MVLTVLDQHFYDPRKKLPVAPKWAKSTIKSLPAAHGQRVHGQAATDAHEDQESDGEDW